MKIVIAPDSFKESLSALEVARAIESGFREVFPDLTALYHRDARGGTGPTGRRFDMQAGKGLNLRINEVATRDGFQMECHFIETDDKVALIDTLGRLGYAKIEVTSFTSPQAIPALRDAEAVMCEIARYPSLAFTAHFHNTRAMGLVNTIAAIEAGIRTFDMSLGGIGGCPYAPGASGNVATEDVVHMLECMEYDTGIDLDGLIGASEVLGRLVGHELPAQVSRAGHRLKQHAPPAEFDAIRTRALTREAAQ